jgi:hypothetical protein
MVTGERTRGSIPLGGTLGKQPTKGEVMIIRLFHGSKWLAISFVIALIMFDVNWGHGCEAIH